MNKYETLFIIKPGLPEDAVEAVVTRLSDRIQKADGKVAAIDYWGNRRLAYAVPYRGEKLRRGYYILLTYLGHGATVEEVERNIKILDDTFRYITVKLAEKVDPESVVEPVINRASGPETPVAPPPEAPAEGAPEAAPAEAAAETPAEAAADDKPAETADAAAAEAEAESAPENKEE